MGQIIFRMNVNHFNGASLNSEDVTVNVKYNCGMLRVFPNATAPSLAESVPGGFPAEAQFDQGEQPPFVFNATVN